MSGQLTSVTATAPLPGGAAVVPGQPTEPGAAASLPVAATTGGGAGATGDDPRVLAQLQQFISVLQQLIAAQSAQLAGASIIGGGSAAPTADAGMGASALGPPAAMTVIGGGGDRSQIEVIGASGGPSMGLIGGVDSASASPVITTDAVGAGPAAVAAPAPVAAPVAVAAPAAAAAPVTAGGGEVAAPPTTQIDMRRVAGTPQPGGVIDVAIRSASVTAASARSEGAWTVLTDGNGAQLQAHVHGAWASNPDRIVEGIQRGFVAAHLHADGTIHMHDIV